MELYCRLGSLLAAMTCGYVQKIGWFNLILSVCVVFSQHKEQRTNKEKEYNTISNNIFIHS